MAESCNCSVDPQTAMNVPCRCEHSTGVQGDHRMVDGRVVCSAPADTPPTPDWSKPDPTPARAAYEVWRLHNWPNGNGGVPWDQTSASVQIAWKAAARAAGQSSYNEGYRAGHKVGHAAGAASELDAVTADLVETSTVCGYDLGALALTTAAALIRPVDVMELLDRDAAVTVLAESTGQLADLFITWLQQFDGCPE